jgi:hypothetical protein
MYVRTEYIYGACGVSVISDFEINGVLGVDLHEGDLTKDAGIGYTLAAFVNAEPSRIVYDVIQSKYKIVFQSPVKINMNSGNEFFFIIFTEKD